MSNHSAVLVDSGLACSKFRKRAQVYYSPVALIFAWAELLFIAISVVLDYEHPTPWQARVFGANPVTAREHALILFISLALLVLNAGWQSKIRSSYALPSPTPLIRFMPAVLLVLAGTDAVTLLITIPAVCPKYSSTLILLLAAGCLCMIARICIAGLVTLLDKSVVKRVLDIFGATSAIILLLPLFFVTGIAIKLDSAGPIIFRQRRRGFNNSEFLILKFRTMTVLEDGEHVIQATRGDKRITRIGRVLRKSSVDELPQLFNVLLGNMSLVGPRPHALAHDAEYGALIRGYNRRHDVKPGITGWAQVHGLRGETAHIEQMRSRIQLDIWYTENWSLLTDVRIMIRTCYSLMKLEAY